MTSKAMKCLHLLSICSLLFIGAFACGNKAIAGAPCNANLQLPSMDNPIGGIPCGDGSGGSTGGGQIGGGGPPGGSGGTIFGPNGDPQASMIFSDLRNSCQSSLSSRAQGAVAIAQNNQVAAGSHFSVTLSDGKKESWANNGGGSVSQTYSQCGG